MRKNGLSVKLSASVLAFLLAFPLQTIWAATGEATTKVKHKPPKESYVPGFRIELKAEMEDKIGFLTTRCYFKAKNDSAFTFVNMFPAGGDNFKGILPAPWVNSEYIEYLFVAVNRNKKVARTQMFKIEEAETKEAVHWKEAGEVKEIRVDQAQEIVEEYEGLRKELRSRYNQKKADYQIEVQDGMALSTELDPAIVSFNGFYDSVTATLVPASARYGLSVEGLYTAEQMAMAGGSAAVAETGAASAGTVIASSGMSGGAVLGTALVAAAVIGGGAAGAIALSNDDDDDDDDDNGNTPPPGAIPCDQLTRSGGDAPESHVVHLGKKAGTFVFEYDTQYVKDRMEVTYENRVIFDTGCVSTGSVATRSITYSGNSTVIGVNVYPNCAGGSGTWWQFKVNCP